MKAVGRAVAKVVVARGLVARAAEMVAVGKGVARVVVA